MDQLHILPEENYDFSLLDKHDAKHNEILCQKEKQELERLKGEVAGLKNSLRQIKIKRQSLETTIENIRAQIRKLGFETDKEIPDVQKSALTKEQIKEVLQALRNQMNEQTMLKKK